MNGDMMNSFIINTNKYCEVNKISNWLPLTPLVMWQFIFIIIYMGVNKSNNRELYWQREGMFRRDVTADMMTLKRFAAILQHLHYKDFTGSSPAQHTVLRKATPFWLVNKFIEDFSSLCQKYFQLGQFCNIDEMCVQFRGRHAARCYNPNKPNKFHLKFFCLNDSVTGYLVKLKPYLGADAERMDAGWSATAWPVF